MPYAKAKNIVLMVCFLNQWYPKEEVRVGSSMEF